jgi:CheY-like chemotaxis protein
MMSFPEHGISTLMVVEDSDEDFEALLRVFRKLGIEEQVQRCVSGQDCLDELALCLLPRNENSRPLPALILLDLNLPGMDGREALQAIKINPKFKKIPVTIVTTSASPHDVEACYADGSNAYLIKSLDYDEFANALSTTMEFWLNAVQLPAELL